MASGGDNRRHDLCYQQCFVLIPASQDDASTDDGVNVALPGEPRCGSCGRHLFVLLDCNLQNPRLDFLGLEGQRLCIAMCPTCTLLGELVYIDVGLDGSFQWSEENGEWLEDPLEGINDWEDFPQPPYGVLKLGPERITAYETYRAHGQEGRSQIGGFPEWVQSPEYPGCPLCQRSMRYVGQVLPLDMHAEIDIDGMLYAFICKICMETTVMYQQS